MLLTDAELEHIRLELQAQAGLDAELAQRCGHLVHLGAFDEAVRSAFVLLEERLRKATGVEGMTGTALANRAFNADPGSLALRLTEDKGEREGLRELFSGAFKLFRNPSAHGVVGYTPSEGKAILELVNLLLGILKRVDDHLPPGALPANVESTLTQITAVAGAAAANRLRVFLGKGVRRLGLKPVGSAKQWIAFRRRGLYKSPESESASPSFVPAFYLVNTGELVGIAFSIDYFRNVVDFDGERVEKALATLGFVPQGKRRDPFADIRTHNDQTFFDSLYDLVASVVDDLEETLHHA